jgi:F-type H+-transporting ATPase subunit gamma
MASVRQIARRIRSVENTAKITKAMSMIAASKLRRTQDAATQGRSYAESMSEMVSNVMSQSQEEELSQPLAEPRDVSNVGLVLITPDRGLTGGLNSNVLRATGDFIGDQSVPVKVVALGKKGIDFTKRNGLQLIAEITGIGDRPSSLDTASASRAIIDGFNEGAVDSVYVAHSKFITTTLQRPVVKQLVPVVSLEMSTSDNVGYIFEPDANAVLSELLPRYVETLIHHAVLESNASEQSARMVAMNQATDSANDMVDDLTLLMNKLRQETITNELLDIVGGVAAVEN